MTGGSSSRRASRRARRRAIRPVRRWASASPTGLKANVGAGAKVAAGAAAAGFAIASKGAIEMENAMARYRAETGATAEEAKRAIGAVNTDRGPPAAEPGGRHRRGHPREARPRGGGRGGRQTHRGLCCGSPRHPAGCQCCGECLRRYPRLVGPHHRRCRRHHGPAGGEPAEVSGGSIEANQVTLAALAPAMRAANLEIGDGIELLNLFGAKGLDANTASAAFAKALTKVKSPEELQSADRRYRHHRGRLRALAEGGRPVRRPGWRQAGERAGGGQPR